MNLKIKILGLAILLGASQTMAAEVCQTLAQCQALKAKVDARIKELQASMPSVLGDFLSDSSGKVQTRIKQSEASDACERLGSRLPTARELAKHVVQSQRGMGPGGVDGVAMLDVADYNAGKIPAGFAKNDFYLVTAKEADEKEDKFYYSRRNYKRPAGDEGDLWIWSSSLNPYFSAFAWDFSGYDGNLVLVSVIPYSRVDVDSARCVSAPGVDR